MNTAAQPVTHPSVFINIEAINIHTPANKPLPNLLALALAQAVTAGAPPANDSHAGNHASLAPVKILADGTQVPASDPRTDHVAVLFPDTGWMIHPVTLTNDGEAFDNEEQAVAACKALRVLGHDDWQLATRQVWERHVLDLTRYEPAVELSLFPGIRKSGWHHTGSECAWTKDKKTGVASSAWGVDSSHGYVNGNRRNYGGFALAARRSGQ